MRAMTSRMVDQYCAELLALGVAYELYDHPPLKAVADVIKELGIGMQDSLPTLLMKADGANVALVIRGDCKVDFKKAKKLLGVGDLRFMSPDEFTTTTGLPLGAARVYNPGVRTIIDPKVFDQEFLIGGSGDFACSIRYATADLRTLPHTEVAEIV